MHTAEVNVRIETFLAGWLLSVSSVSSVCADAISFNFVGGAPNNETANGGSLLASEIVGAPGYGRQNWNNLTTDFDGGGAAGGGAYVNGPNPLVQNSGANLSLRMWWDSPNTWDLNGGADATVPTGGNERLMHGYLDSNNSGANSANLYTPASQPFFGVADLPTHYTASGYDVVVYFDGNNAGNDRVAEFWLISNAGNPSDVSLESDLTPHLFGRDAANVNFSGTFVQVPGTSTTNEGAATVAGNFLVFEDLTADAFFLRTNEAFGNRAPINAVQIVSNIPEPSAVGLIVLGLGVLGMLGFRRQYR